MAVAVEMPVELFEYHSEVRGNEVVHDLRSYGAAGGAYTERWHFEVDSYRWSLEQTQGGTTERIMGGEYKRSSGGDGS